MIRRVHGMPLLHPCSHLLMRLSRPQNALAQRICEQYIFHKGFEL